MSDDWEELEIGLNGTKPPRRKKSPNKSELLNRKVDNQVVKVSDDDAKKMVEMRARGVSWARIGKYFGVHRLTARAICVGKRRSAATGILAEKKEKVCNSIECENKFIPTSNSMRYCDKCSLERRRRNIPLDLNRKRDIKPLHLGSLQHPAERTWELMMRECK